MYAKSLSEEEMKSQERRDGEDSKEKKEVQKEKANQWKRRIKSSKEN